MCRYVIRGMRVGLDSICCVCAVGKLGVASVVPLVAVNRRIDASGIIGPVVLRKMGLAVIDHSPR